MAVRLTRIPDKTMTTAENRVSSPHVSRIFVDRWSPRAFEPTTIDEQTLQSLFEAARWAPSAYNSQPWRFVYARRESNRWADFLSWLIPFNQSWAQNASALIYVVSAESVLLPGKTELSPAPTHSFDTGAAAMQLVLQAKHAGLAAHTMSGFDANAAREGLGIPKEGYTIHAAIAIGKQGSKEILPEAIAAREFPSDRKAVSQIASEGTFTEIS